MLVINLIALCLCGFIIGTWLLQAILSIQRYCAEKRKAALNEEKSVAKEFTNMCATTVNEENRKLRADIEELTLRLKVEQEAHCFWRNKWAELNNINTKGDNE